MNRTKLLSSVAILSLLLAGCSQADDAAGGPEAAGSQQDEQQSQEQAKAQEAERVKQVKGFYCSSAMDTLSSLKGQASYLLEPAHANGQVEILSMRTEGAGQVLGTGWSSF